MSEHQLKPAPPQQRVLPWYVRLCQWLWKTTLGLGLGSILISLAINLFSTWLTSSKGVISPDSPWLAFLDMLRDHWLIVSLIGCCLLFCTAFIWAISRWGNPRDAQRAASSSEEKKNVPF